MDDVSEPLQTPEMNDAEDRSLASDLRDLVDHGLDFVRTEVELQKARAAYAAQGTRAIAILGVAAGAFLFFAMVALTVGLVIALTPLLTALGATFAVFLGLVLAALILAGLARGRWRKLKAALAIEDGQA